MKSSHRSNRRLGARRSGALVLTIAAAAALAITAVAVANSSTLGVASAKLSGPSGSRTEPIAVSSKGVAVYELLPETTRHLLCSSSMCLQAWPPVKVAAGAKLSKPAGLSGKLGTLRRKGFAQLTLNGHPLYTFIEDAGKKGVAAGDGLKSFGGTWHVFKEGASQSTNSSSGTSPAPTGYTAPAPATMTSTTSSGW